MTQDEYDVQTEFFLETQVIMDDDFEPNVPMPDSPPDDLPVYHNPDEEYPFDPAHYYQNGWLDQ